MSSRCGLIVAWKKNRDKATDYFKSTNSYYITGLWETKAGNLTCMFNQQEMIERLTQHNLIGDLKISIVKNRKAKHDKSPDWKMFLVVKKIILPKKQLVDRIVKEHEIKAMREKTLQELCEYNEEES
jgi:hypothetical protein